MGTLTDIFEGLSGTKKMSYGRDLYDPKEGKKWRGRQEGHYKDFGKSRERYKGQSKKFLDMYGKGRAKAYDMYDRAAGETTRSEGDISRARRYQRSADTLRGDRAFYADLAKDKKRIKDSYADARMQQQALIGRTRRAGRDGSNIDLMKDAFKEMMESEEESLNQRTAALAKTNPVAAAKLKLDFQAQMQKGFGKAVQEGYGRDVQLDMSKIMAESGLVMKGAGLLEGEAAQNAQAFNERQSRIAGYGAAGTGALNTAAMQQNIGAGLTSIAGGLSNMTGKDLQAGMNFAGMEYDALKDQASTANFAVGQQQEREFSDINRRAQVDQFNNMRASRGLSNAIAIAGTATNMYGAVQAANLAGSQADYLRSGLKVADTVASNQGGGQESWATHPRFNNMNFSNNQPTYTGSNNRMRLASNYDPYRMGGDTNQFQEPTGMSMNDLYLERMNRITGGMS